MRKGEQKIFSMSNLIGVPDIDMAKKVRIVKKHAIDVSKTKYPFSRSLPGTNCKHDDVKKIGDSVFRCLDCGFEYSEA